MFRHELRKKLVEQGFRALRDEGVQLARDGRTSLEEVLRATHMEELPTSPARSEREAA